VINHFWSIALLLPVMYFGGLNAGLNFSLLTIAINETVRPTLNTTSYLSSNQKTTLFELAAELEIPDRYLKQLRASDEHDIDHDEAVDELELKETPLKQRSLLAYQYAFRKKLTELESSPLIKGYCEAKTSCHDGMEKYFLFNEAVSRQEGTVAIVPSRATKNYPMGLTKTK
jgi:hypothetical protein